MDRETLELITAPFLASDLAMEVRNVYYEKTGYGVEAGPATFGVFQRFMDVMDDPNEGPVILLAIAALQLREGNVLEAIRAAAVEMIDNGEAAKAWRPAEFSVLKNRAAALEALAEVLR